MSRFVRFFLGAVLGGLVFSLLVLLLAPATGKDMRARIIGFVTNITGEVRQAASQRRKELEQELAVMRMPQMPKG
jgi:gas vesicle protein